MTNIGTPDWQYGVVSAGMLLASEPGTSASVTVAIPPNAKTLFVFALPGNDWKGLRCVGATTGVEYPGVQRLLTFNITSNYCVLFDVASQVDSSVIITWALQPSEQWYVYSSSSTHVVDVPELAAMAQEPNVPPVNFGILAIGSDGTDARILATDSSGRQIPLVPTVSANSLMTAGTEAILGAPASGAWYLFKLSVMPNGVFTSGEITLRDSSGGLIDAVADGGTTPTVIDLHGFRVTTGLEVTSSVLNKILVLHYAPGP